MRKRPYIAGFIAADSLLALFIVLVTSISGWATARNQFTHYWYFILPLAVGFGIQVGLYVYLREVIRKSASGKVMAVTGTTSTAAMISCCAHYLVNILPILGATGIAAFVGQYQIQLFWVGLLFNAAGVVYIGQRIRRFKQHRKFMLAPVNVQLPTEPNPFMNNAVVLSVFAVVVVGVWLATKPNALNSDQTAGVIPASGVAQAQATSGTLATKTNTAGGMTVAVTPKQASDDLWEFGVQIDNHVQEVSQDMVAVSSLTTSSGTSLRPTAWDGDPPGGHHRHGTLKFSQLPAGTTGVTLTMNNLGGVAARTFTWDNLPT